MRITIITVGTRGDVQPYIALGVGLKKAGHNVRIAAAPNFEAFVREYHLDFAPIGVDFKKLMEENSVSKSLDTKGKGGLKRTKGPAFREAFERCAYESLGN